jgi:hypothetical protein
VCGPSAAQTNISNEQQEFFSTLTSEATQTYGEDQGILSQLTSAYEPILARGPNQQGFSTSEVQDLNAQAVEGTAENYSAAAKATNENLASEGGGNNPLPTGAQTQLKSEVAQSAAQEESREESQIQGANYAQGNAEFNQASNALLGTSGQINPLGYAGSATGAGNAAANEANSIEQEENSWLTPVLGAVGAIGAGALKGH